MKYQYVYITVLGLFFIALHCISFLVLSCIVLLYSALLFVKLSLFFLPGYKFNKLNLNPNQKHSM